MLYFEMGLSVLTQNFPLLGAIGRRMRMPFALPILSRNKMGCHLCPYNGKSLPWVTGSLIPMER